MGGREGGRGGGGEEDISHLINFFAAIPKDKVCESSPIELNIVAFGQWNLGRPTGKDR